MISRSSEATNRAGEKRRRGEAAMAVPVSPCPRVSESLLFRLPASPLLLEQQWAS